ncbi:unnamed protein product [Lactuca saligna]|uniref:Ubiquitin-like protease family profile domain-containing protein n=1 Tax=Lactuca saligna TaxID=75948 RepID=A0AA36EQW5_LACSI|nr:unnamed protein product [Lactuca saligna]
MKDKDPSFDGHSNKRDGDGVKEAEFSPIRGLVVEVVKKDDGGGFSTPQMDKMGNTDNLTCSQFLENPEVLATAIKITDKAVLESYKKEKNRGKKVMETVEVCEEDDDHRKRGKRDQKIPVYGKSHFVERIVRMSDKVKKDEMSLYNSVFASKRDYGEEIWNIGSGHVLHQGFAYHFKSNTFIHAIIIDCWSSLLNRMEELRDVGSFSRVFFDTNFLAEEILGVSLSPERTQELFDSILKLHLKSLAKQKKLKDIGLDFFPIVDRRKYYLICFDLRVPTYFIIDHVTRNGSVEEIYGIKHIHVKKLLGNYLKTKYYQKSTAFHKIKASVMKMTWKVEKEGSDCGVYLMRHMESYMGENEGRWDCGFTRKKQTDLLALNNLRIKYMARLMKSEYKKHKSMLEKDAEAYERLDPLHILAIMNEVKEIREKQKHGRRRF